MRFLSAILLMIFLFSTAGLRGQALVTSVKAEYEHLPNDERDDLYGFANKVEQYFNGYEWIEDEFEYDVKTNVTIIIETVQKKTFEKMYKAQFVINSESGETFYDKVWEFPYEKTFPLNHIKSQFDPLTHFLDFYAYMVLAGEMDMNGLLLGTPLYNQAMDIASQALLSQYSKGWSQRMETLQKITHVRTRPLREVKPDFLEATFLMQENKPEEAYKYAKKVLAGIEKVARVQPNNRYLAMFFNAHYRELANFFAGHNEELNKLVEYDSKHRQAYREVMQR